MNNSQLNNNSQLKVYFIKHVKDLVVNFSDKF